MPPGPTRSIVMPANRAATSSGMASVVRSQSRASLSSPSAASSPLPPSATTSPAPSSLRTASSSGPTGGDDFKWNMKGRLLPGDAHRLGRPLDQLLVQGAHELGERLVHMPALRHVARGRLAQPPGHGGGA